MSEQGGNNRPGAWIVGLGCAVPRGRVGQDSALRFAVEHAGLTGDAERFAGAIYRRSGVASRGSVIVDGAAPANGDRVEQGFFAPDGRTGGKGPGTAARMLAFDQHARGLAIEAARRAILDGGSTMDAGQITHLVVVTCTGFSAPGIDVALIDALGLGRGVERLTIGFMGCHGGVVGLRTARSMAMAAAGEGKPARVLVVCIELCSLHFQYSDRPDQIVANALFADGAGAALVSSTPCAGVLAVQAGAGRVFEDCLGAMGWAIGDHGFEMTLAESVPGLIRRDLRGWLDGWLGSCGVELAEARERALWAVHPGGPRVLDAVGEALELPREALACSREVLAENGNMSSATVLFILERMRGRAVAERRPVVMLGFGPGLTVEGALIA